MPILMSFDKYMDGSTKAYRSTPAGIYYISLSF